MSASFEVIERIEDECELRKPSDVELGVLDVGVVCFDFDVRIESLRNVFRDQSLGLLDVFVTEEELAIEVTEVDSIEIDDMDFAEAGQDEVLEEFAANAAGAYEEDFGLRTSKLTAIAPSGRYLTSTTRFWVTPSDCFTNRSRGILTEREQYAASWSNWYHDSAEGKAS